jgi:putative ATPase
MRPHSFEQFYGQHKIVAPGTPLRLAIENDKVSSIIFWGPPGTGKTTLAELIARATHGQFVRFSAVTSGIKEVKEVLSKAGHYYQMSGRRTYVFIDEIHRFNKAQQDAFLPYVEKGDIILIGATTENPSFEVNSALLSRCRVFVLERLTEVDLINLTKQAISDEESGLGKLKLTMAENAYPAIAAAADGDARRALSLLEAIASYVGIGGEITVEAIRAVHQKNFLQYDKAGEEHFNLISALHKAVRGGDPDASLYYLARMLAAGDDPLYICRRLIRFASEDVGLADSFALTLAMNTRDAYHFLGSPEGELAIAQLVVYLACAPKSNSIYTAFGQAMHDAETKGSLPVPLWIRNAPTKLMKSLGYGKDYQYAHDFENAITDQEYFPEPLAGTEYYHPRKAGKESRIVDYLEMYKEYRRKVMGDKPSGPDSK